MKFRIIMDMGGEKIESDPFRATRKQAKAMAREWWEQGLPREYPLYVEDESGKRERVR